MAENNLILLRVLTFFFLRHPRRGERFSLLPLKSRVLAKDEERLQAGHAGSSRGFALAAERTRDIYFLYFYFFNEKGLASLRSVLIGLKLCISARNENNSVNFFVRANLGLAALARIPLCVCLFVESPFRENYNDRASHVYEFNQSSDPFLTACITHSIDETRCTKN